MQLLGTASTSTEPTPGCREQRPVEEGTAGRASLEVDPVGPCTMPFWLCNFELIT